MRLHSNRMKSTTGRGALRRGLLGLAMLGWHAGTASVVVIAAGLVVSATSVSPLA